MVVRFLILISLLFSVTAVANIQVIASVDKNPAMLGESVTLDVTVNARVNADTINFRQLESHFTVMVPSVSQSTSVVNGVSNQSTRWQVVLLPKKTGSFTIPAFTVNGASSTVLTLDVVEREQNNTQSSQELFLESEIEHNELYVQQLTYYQVTIYFSGELQRGSLTEPVLDGAVIQQVGQDVDSSTLVNGIRYRTITRRYAITPQRSGTFEISPPTFSGEVFERDNARYSYFARTKTVVQQAQPQSITVKAAPVDFPGDWLVAGLVTLSEEWVPEQSELIQGEPVTRIITLSAVDVADNQLPELKQGFPAGVRLYQEQPQSKAAERNGRIIAQKIFTTAVIATDAGTVELPEISLPWWNSQTNQVQYTTLPGRTLKIKANTQADQTATPAEPVIAASTSPEQVIAPSAWHWNHLTSLLCGLWILSLLLIYIFWQLRAQKEIIPTVQSGSKVKFNSSKLKQACETGDSRTAKAELLRFAHQQLDKKCRSLSELSALINDEALQTQLALLNTALYQSGQQSWDGKALYQSWKNYKPQHNHATTDSLPPLYRN